MTKKSQSRISRDEYEKAHKTGSTCWNDLNNIYNACFNAVTNAKARINELYTLNHVRPFLDNSVEIAINIRGVVDDSRRLLESLEVIHAKHATKEGGAEVDTNDLIESLQLSGEYEQWQSHLELALLPTVEYLIAEFTTAHTRFLMKESLAKAETTSNEEAPATTETH